MDPSSEGRWLAAWRAGEPEAFERLVERYQSPLLAHARAMLGTRGGEEDVVQDAFLRLAQRPPDLPAPGEGGGEAAGRALAAWLHTVTRNLCMDALRSESRRRRRERSAAATEAVSGGLERVEAADTRAAVERGLERLPADQREVLVLRLLGERSYREIAEITGRKTGTVGWLISVGMKALTAELAPLVASRGDETGASASPSLQGGLS